MEDIQGSVPNDKEIMPTNKAEKPRRVRRVGTMTMGVALIIVGAAICASLLFKNIDILLLAKLAPLVLVALGIEIVIAACTNRTDKLKYDGLSIFMCLMLIFFSVCAAFVPTIFAYIGPQAEAARSNISMEISDKLYEQKAQLPKISDVRVNVSIQTLHEFTGKETIKDLAVTDDVYVYVVLGDTYNDKKAFVQDADKIYDALVNIRGTHLRMGIMSAKTDKKPYYEMEIYGKFNADLAVEDKVNTVSVLVFDSEYNDYLSEEDINRNNARQEKEKAQEAKRLEDENTRLEQSANDEAQRILENAENEAQRILDDANAQAQRMIETVE